MQNTYSFFTFFLLHTMLSLYALTVFVALYYIVPFNAVVWISCITGFLMLIILCAVVSIMAIPYITVWRAFNAANISMMQFITDPVYTDECLRHMNAILAEVGYVKLERKDGEILWEGKEFSEDFGKAIHHFVRGLRTFQPILHAMNTSCEFKVINTNTDTSSRKYMQFDSEYYIYSCDERTKNWCIRHIPTQSVSSVTVPATSTESPIPAMDDNVKI